MNHNSKAIDFHCHAELGSASHGNCFFETLKQVQGDIMNMGETQWKP
jgi:hypothetical protein